MSNVVAEFREILNFNEYTGECKMTTMETIKEQQIKIKRLNEEIARYSDLYKTAKKKIKAQRAEIELLKEQIDILKGTIEIYEHHSSIYVEV